MDKNAAEMHNQKSELRRSIEGLNSIVVPVIASEGNQAEPTGGGAARKGGAAAAAAKPDKKSAVKKPVKKAKAEPVIDHPALQKMLRKSTVQKTLRFSPVLYAEYEQMCQIRDMDANFNKHMNEALELLLDKYRS